MWGWCKRIKSSINSNINNNDNNNNNIHNNGTTTTTAASTVTSTTASTTTATTTTCVNNSWPQKSTYAWRCVCVRVHYCGVWKKNPIAKKKFHGLVLKFKIFSISLQNFFLSLQILLALINVLENKNEKIFKAINEIIVISSCNVFP